MQSLEKKETKLKYLDKGLGTTHKQIAVSVKLSPHIDAIVRSLPNRSEFLRAAIAEKLEREGLLPKSEDTDAP